MEGGSFDGQYFHLSVPAHLTEALHFSDQFICTWDALHKDGVVDNHICEDSSFSWLVEIQTICREIFALTRHFTHRLLSSTTSGCNS